MGTDIHGVFQRKTDKGWEDIPSKWKQERHYFLFSFLADVRNGYGFAGVPTYEPINPISSPRGLPEDFSMDGDEHLTTMEVLGRRAKYVEDKNKPTLWMGDHSHSWLLSSEILTAAEKMKNTTRTGVISLEAFKKWDRISCPAEYSGGISGPNIHVAASPLAINSKTSHVQVTWVENDKDDIAYFLKEVIRLQKDHGLIRLVFGFDS
jgi:hypothetical protein